MCYQLVEIYSACRCLYYQHAVDRCFGYGQPSHAITKKTILVGYSCQQHAQSPDIGSDSGSQPPHNLPPSKIQPKKTLKEAIRTIRQRESNNRSEKYTNSPRKRRLARSQEVRPNPEDSFKGIVSGKGDDDTDGKANNQNLSSDITAEYIPDPPAIKHSTSLANSKPQEVVIPFNTSVEIELPLPSRNTRDRETRELHNNHETGPNPYYENIEAPTSPNGNLDNNGSRDADIESNIDLSIDHFYEEEILGDAISSKMASIFDGTKHTKSSVTSAHPSDSLNAIDLLANSLIYDRTLQYLWPQLFLWLDSKELSCEYITRLLFRYSMDLQNLAQNMEGSEAYTRNKRAAKFVERKREVLAQEICNWFPLPGSYNNGAETQSSILDDIPVELDNDIDEDIETGEVTQFDLVKDFLFQTDPFYYFRENVRVLVEQPLVLPLRIRGFDYARQWFDNLWASLHKPTLQMNHQRVYYTCKCGQKLYDDYSESREGALLDLKLLLSQYGIQAVSSGDVESQLPQAPATNAKIPLFVPSKPRRRLPDIRLPVYWQSQNKLELGKCRSKSRSNEIEDKHNYILACIPFGRSVFKLRQPEVCTVDSDQDFFALLRVMYRESRSKLPLSLLRRVKSIKFVQLEMYRAALADVRSHPSLPPDHHKDQYFYDPMPADLMPPIGSNLLVHLFENPTHAGVLPNLYSRIPKKLREKLTPCPQKGTSIGWGLAFTEGIDTFVFFLCGCVGFLICLLVALVWTLVKSDVQGGFGIGAFLLSFMVFCGGLIHSSIAVTGQN